MSCPLKNRLQENVLWNRNCFYLYSLQGNREMKRNIEIRKTKEQARQRMDPRELISTKDEETLDVQLMYAAVVQVSKLV